MCLEQRITNVMIPSGFWDHRPAHNSTAVLLGTHTNIIYMLVAGHWRADHQPHYLSVVFARQRRSGDKRQTKRKTKTPNPLVLDRALSRCFVCWLVCLLVSCVFVCLSVCVCLFVSLLLGLFVCGCLFPCLLARLVCLWERERGIKKETTQAECISASKFFVLFVFFTASGFIWFHRGPSQAEMQKWLLQEIICKTWALILKSDVWHLPPRC